MLGQAARKIVVADHRKIGATGTALISSINTLDVLITDEGATDRAVAPFIKRGLTVIRV
jgi:DeoR/GlpR family transcriptional regulator of sugar metabolism